MSSRGLLPASSPGSTACCPPNTAPCRGCDRWAGTGNLSKGEAEEREEEEGAEAMSHIPIACPRPHSSRDVAVAEPKGSAAAPTLSTSKETTLGLVPAPSPASGSSSLPGPSTVRSPSSSRRAEHSSLGTRRRRWQCQGCPRAAPTAMPLPGSAACMSAPSPDGNRGCLIRRAYDISQKCLIISGVSEEIRKQACSGCKDYANGIIC